MLHIEFASSALAPLAALVPLALRTLALAPSERLQGPLAVRRAQCMIWKRCRRPVTHQARWNFVRLHAERRAVLLQSRCSLVAVEKFVRLSTFWPVFEVQLRAASSSFSKRSAGHTAPIGPHIKHAQVFEISSSAGVYKFSCSVMNTKCSKKSKKEFSKFRKFSTENFRHSLTLFGRPSSGYRPAVSGSILVH